MPVVAELWCVAALLALAGLGVILGHRSGASPLLYGAALVVSLAALTNALLALAGPATALILPMGLPWIGAQFRLDALSAFFLVLINLGGAAASLYAIGYGRHAAEPQRVLPFFPAFLAGMNLVLVADDAFSFLLTWESMSLASWALVMADHRAGETRMAGYVYLLMASFGTLMLLLAFATLAGPEAGYAFSTMRAHGLSPVAAGLVLGLALLGAGSKAGLVPLHAWLPLAHPAAPSHVSALMSAVMTKVAVYGFIRIVFDLLGAPDWWWGIPVLALGGASAALGVLYALMQTDIKKVLAYSTIENIGIIFVGLGLALAFQANHLPTAAALALTAALFHALNHALFKSALFFGAGAVLTATGARELDRMGGLIHRMPATSALMLAACAAISALPPLNGFASEWLTFQAILLSPQLPAWGLKLMVPAVGALLALSAALAAACFVRLYGIAFLGRPRSPEAASAHEVDRWSLAAMGLMALGCIGAGILPGVVIDALAPVVHLVLGERMPAQAGTAWLSIIPIAESRSSYNGLLVLVFVAGSAALMAGVIHRFASRAVRRAPAWDCGFPDAGIATQYSASSFAQPLRRVFGTSVFAARERIHMPPPGDASPARLEVELKDPVWSGLYAPLADGVWALSGRLNPLQFLTIRRYLSLVFAALVLLLLVLALWT
ncbi:hydrogenase 4 subunit B [Azorhizobium sp. AG788]|uniref:hydrogenase 4 subunit B n=1 Tax=Azorhizobium sp. AG788 TaxID=2183897 RepID=UPI0031394632